MLRKEEGFSRLVKAVKPTLCCWRVEFGSLGPQENTAAESQRREHEYVFGFSEKITRLHRVGVQTSFHTDALVRQLHHFAVPARIVPNIHFQTKELISFQND